MSVVAEVIKENPRQELKAKKNESVIFRRCPPKKNIHGPKKNPRLNSMQAVDSYSGDNSATSGMEDLDAEERKGQKRRKKRKRTLSKLERSIKFKAVQIEKALHSKDSSWAGDETVSCDDDVSSTNDEKITSKNMMTLQELAIADHGLINDDLRRRAWPRLAKLNIYATSLLPTQEEVENHTSYNQVVLDVNRSLKRFPPGISEEERPDLQDQLTRLIVRVLYKHPNLHYYQGFHDVAITFLLVVGEQLGFHIVEKLSANQLKDFMGPTLERTTFLLQFMYPIFKKECLELHDFLEESEVGTIFALPWLITWFSHVLPNYQDVVRLFDFFLAQPGAPMMPVYLAASIVLHRKNEVLVTSCDMASVHGLLSSIPSDLPLEKLLVIARNLYESYPPIILEPEVKLRMQELQEEMKKAQERMDNIRKRNLEKKLVKPDNAGQQYSNLFKFLVATIPVVLGAVAYGYLNHLSSPT